MISKLILTDISVSWRVDYDEKGEPKGKHVALFASASENVPNGRRIGGQVSMSEQMFDSVQHDPMLLQKWVFAEVKHLWVGLAMKSNDLGIDIDVSEVYTPMVQKFLEGMTKFCENEMPWYHTFYLVKTIMPGRTWLNEDGTPAEPVTEPTLVIVKAD